MSMEPYHVGVISPKQYLFLMKVDAEAFQWFTSFDAKEAAPCTGRTPAEAIHAAYQFWKDAHFRLLNCGFRYSLPERDEVGCKAFFWEMAKSYASFNGQYLDDELGHRCYVDFASQEALALWRDTR